MMKTWTLVLTVLSMATPGSAARAEEPGADYAALVDAYHARGEFSGAVLVARAGEVVYEGAVGLANREWSVPNGPATRFRIASVTKQFTALLVMRLVEAGRLDLDAPISEVLPYYRADTGARITVRQLLHHTSGLPEEVTSFDQIDDVLSVVDDVPERIRRFCSGDPSFEPGSRFEYSNTDYLVLGAILEQLHGKTFETVLREEILDPLGMDATGLESFEAVVPNRATGYVRVGDRFERRLHFGKLAWAAAGMVSTVGDLFRWNRALMGHELLSEEWTRVMFTPRPAGSSTDNYAALGSWVYSRPLPGSDRRPRLVERRGYIAPFTALNVLVPEDGHCIVLLANVDPADIHTLPYARGLPLDLLCALYDVPVTPPAPPPAADEAGLDEDGLDEGGLDEDGLDEGGAREDVALFRRALERIHPGLRRYASAETLAAAFARLEELAVGGTTDVALYRELSLAAAALRCGHTRVEAPPRIAALRRSTPTHLPFRFRWLEGRMIVDVAEAGTGLRRGDEVVEIDGESVAALMERLGAAIPVDGFTDSVRPSRLDAQYEFQDAGFDHYLPIFQGFRDTFELRLADGRAASVAVVDEARSIELAGGSAWIDFKDAVHVSDLGGGAARLDVGTFVNYRDPVDPVATFADAFARIEALGADHLVLDLRRCGGGSSDVAWTLARFLLDDPIEFKAPWVRFRRVGDLRPYLSTWDERAFEMPDAAFEDVGDGWSALRPEAVGRAVRLEPRPDRFRGRVTVLVGPANASGSTMLLAKLKEAGRARFVGAPTGGSAEGPTAGLLFDLTLPNSGIVVKLPALFERNSVEEFAPGLGVTPDVLVEETVADFLAGRDRTLERALAP